MKLDLAGFAAGLRNIRLFRLTVRQVQIPLAAMVVVLLAAGAFAWQSPRDSESEAAAETKSVENFAPPSPVEKPLETNPPDFVTKAIGRISQTKRFPSSGVDSDTALAILIGAKSDEVDFDFLPALAGPDENLSSRHVSDLTRLVASSENDDVAQIKPVVIETASSPEAVPTRAAAEPTELPAWRRFAALSKETGKAPIIAIVIDDLGHTEREFARAMSLGEGITLAFLPYTERVAEFARQARENGFEILVHMPMEPTDATADPGPNALLTGLSDAELSRRLALNLSRLEGYVGINNHMGSKFSQDRRAMTLVLGELEARGLLYLDSVTIGSTVGEPIAAAARMPFASRDVFLDSVAEKGFIEGQLRVVEKVARQTGHAVAIGHPYAETMEVLKRWLPDARERGFEFVPISTVAALECAC
jgi:polysaccharide deacetylase 2 family uncharacterized protein YibQ